MSILSKKEKLIKELTIKKLNEEKQEIALREQQERTKFLASLKEKQEIKKDPKMLSVAILGIPNTGKSTLMNYLVREKISATSGKVQTTRKNVIGVMTHENYQIEFIDTPGLLSPKQRRKISKTKTMLEAAWSTLKQVNIVIILIDATKPLDDMMHVFQEFKNYNKPRDVDDQIRVIGVVNKIDLIDFKETEVLMADLGKIEAFDEVFTISAQTGYKVEDVKEYLFSKSISNPWKYKENAKTSLTRRQRVEEIIREKIYRRLNQEVPYQVGVKVRKLEDQENLSIRIEAELQVHRKAHKPIVLQSLSYIQSRAKEDLEKIFAQKVFLIFNVVETDENETDFGDMD